MATMPALPLELWRLIIDHVADENDYGVHWQSTTESTQALRALSQVNSSFRPIAMRLLWQYIDCEADGVDIDHLASLQRVINAIHQGCKGDKRRHKTTRAPPRKATDGRCSGPCEYIKSINISFEFFEDDSGDFEEDLAVIGQRACYGDIASFYSDVDGRQPRLPHIDAFHNFLATLAKSLQSCHHFRRFSWTGQLRPSVGFYKELSKCPGLESFSLELGPSCIPSKPFSRSMKYIQDDPLYLLADQVTDLTLGFGTEAMSFGRGRDLKYSDMTQSKFLVCQGLVKWLAAPNKLSQMSFAAPLLLYQPWLLPLWAQLEYIETDLQWSMMREDVGDDDLPEELPVWGEPLLIDDLPYETAVNMFHYLIKDNLCGGWDQDPPIPILPKQIFDLIHAEEDLEAWREWFPIWPENESTDDRTVQIMTEVAARINPKPAQMESGRSKKRGVKRRRSAECMQ